MLSLRIESHSVPMRNFAGQRLTVDYAAKSHLTCFGKYLNYTLHRLQPPSGVCKYDITVAEMTVRRLQKPLPQSGDGFASAEDEGVPQGAQTIVGYTQYRQGRTCRVDPLISCLGNSS